MKDYEKLYRSTLQEMKTKVTSEGQEILKECILKGQFPEAAKVRAECAAIGKMLEEIKNSPCPHQGIRCFLCGKTREEGGKRMYWGISRNKEIAICKICFLSMDEKEKDTMGLKGY